MTMLLLGLSTLATPAHAGVVENVDVANFSFTPKQLIIDQGTTVQWDWISGSHSVTAAAGQIESFDSGIQGAGSSFSHTFNNAGAVNYYCTPHGNDTGGGNVSGMSASVTVLPSTGPAMFATGTCPGTVSVTMESGTPNGRWALLTASSQGSDPIPAGPCAGITTGLRGITFRGLFPADATGTRVMTPNLPAGVCGQFLQALDVDTCTLTNLAVLPRP